jgi:hypothetical protein
MAWMTIQEASERGPSRATWERRVATGQVASYVNPLGRRMVWIAGSEPSMAELHHELRELNAEVREVLDRLAALGCDIEALRTAPAERGAALQRMAA